MTTLDSDLLFGSGSPPEPTPEPTIGYQDVVAQPEQDAPEPRPADDARWPSHVEPSFRPLADTVKLWGPNQKSAQTVAKNPRRVAVDMLRLFLSIKTPITLWGPVGARKTRTIEALKDEHDENGTPYQVITLQPSTEDPTVIHGLMYTTLDSNNETLMKRSVPDVANQITQYWEKHHGLTVLFLDEMTTCMPAQQHALLGILTHARYGDTDLSDYITIVMAANPPGTVSTVNPLGEQVLNRGGHIAWFGDVEIFLEEWRSGFGSAAAAPDGDTDWYITSMLYEKYEAAFRAEAGHGRTAAWEPGSLVPYESMEHTERAVTELAKLVALINDKFSGAAKSVRRAYIIEVTRALLGPVWAERMSSVTDKEDKRVSPQEAVKVFDASGVTATTSVDELRSVLGRKLFSLSNQQLTESQTAAVATGLHGMCARAESAFPVSPYLTFWAMYETAQPNRRGLLHSYVVNMFLIADAAVGRGLMAPTDAIPAFLSQETREYIKMKLATLRG